LWKCFPPSNREVNAAMRSRCHRSLLVRGRKSCATLFPFYLPFLSPYYRRKFSKQRFVSESAHPTPFLRRHPSRHRNAPEPCSQTRAQNGDLKVPASCCANIPTFLGFTCHGIRYRDPHFRSRVTRTCRMHVALLEAIHSPLHASMFPLPRNAVARSSFPASGSSVSTRSCVCNVNDGSCTALQVVLIDAHLQH